MGGVEKEKPILPLKFLGYLSVNMFIVFIMINWGKRRII
jgi:hypothetical protein